jgi:hypothetical protein
MVSPGMLRRVALVRTDVSEELSASFTGVIIGELRTTLAVTSNRRRQRRFLQEPHSVTSQKMPFFMRDFGCHSDTVARVLRVLRFRLPLSLSTDCSTIITSYDLDLVQ